MNKLITSIIGISLLCVCSGAILACGTNTNSNDNQSPAIVPTDDIITPPVPTHYGIRVKDGNGAEVYRTSWDDCKDTPSTSEHIFCVLPEYSVTLKKDVDYNLNGFMLSRDFEDSISLFHENDIIDDEDNYQTRIYSWTFDYDSEKIAIDKTDCSYHEFNFKGLQSGECSVQFSVIFTTTTHRDNKYNPSIISHTVLTDKLTFNIKFIFE